MRLARLILQGFKSFADKTIIDFSDGMTVIVGPNGCGKSNISDAVRWVLGEQNIRNIRGQKSEDIIFSGAATRAAKNAAEVTLILDNSQHELPLGQAEVAITRRLLRSGESEYQLNRKSCRLKDIQELLANTGLGKGSLAIIGQNRVDQVLMAQPEERRIIFEDVAGISLYRMRKNEGLRKLGRTAENIERVQDLMAVLEEESEPLLEAAQKASAYKKLMAEKKQAEATMILLRLSSSGRMLSRYENEYRTLSDDFAKWTAELARFTVERARIEGEHAKRQSEIRRISEETVEKQRVMETLRGDYRVKEEEAGQLTQKLQELDEELEDQKEAEAEQAAEEKEADREWDEAKAKWEEEKKNLLQAEAARDQMQENVRRAEAIYQEALAINRRKWDEKKALEQSIDREKEEWQRVSVERAKAEKTQASLYEEKEKAEKTRDHIRDEQALLQKEQVRRDRQGKDKKAALEKMRDHNFALGRTHGEENARLEALISRRRYLERSDREYANFSGASRAIMENRGLWEGHIIGPVGDLLRVPDAYTAAAEIALGGTISHIVTDTSGTAASIISWLSGKKAGRTTFYPLESIRSPYPGQLEKEAAQEQGICGIASELFSFDKDYDEIMRYLLGRTLIAENLDIARRVSKKYKYRVRLVTLDGQLVNAGGSLTGGSMRRGENTFFGRRKEIASLIKEEKTMAASLEAMKEKIDAGRREEDTLAEEVTSLRELYQAGEVRRAGLLASLESAENECARLSKTLTDAEIAIKQLEEREKAVKALLEANQEKLSAYDDLTEISEGDDIKALREQAAEAEKQVLEHHVSVTRAEGAVAFQEEARRRSREYGKSLAKNRIELETNRENAALRKDALQEEMKSVDEAFEAAQLSYEDARRSYQALQESTDELSKSQLANEEAWRKAQQAVSECEKNMAERQARIESFKLQQDTEREKLAALGLTADAAEALRMDGTMKELEEFIAQKDSAIEGLGTVNPNGEEEYARQKERMETYRSQILDMKKARDDLEKVIIGIDTTMTKEFTAAFAEINKEFGRVMQLMFQGGKAMLELTDPAHPLEGGVEMSLELPGKKRQPLTLMSGGERALTVIALLISFMAYRPAPFCFLDEIDAALDDANVERYGRMIEDYKRKTQFIVISHRKKTMEFADTLQGVTMEEKGVSSLITVQVGDYIKEE
ncbi:MAG: chromosome segregation protein SMC [Dialister sp.]|nr:chromosome segregation protein SMC [Dialister sp.]